MRHLVYVSSATRDFSVAELSAMLATFRENNARHGITGLLLYKDGHFMQVLEGEAEPLAELFRRIARDPRHKGVITLLEQEVAERSFGEWSMAFPDFGAAEVQALPGFSRFLQTPLRDPALLNPSAAMQLLLSFRGILGKRP